jgi:hypothetical protein
LLARNSPGVLADVQRERVNDSEPKPIPVIKIEPIKIVPNGENRQ